MSLQDSIFGVADALDGKPEGALFNEIVRYLGRLEDTLHEMQDEVFFAQDSEGVLRRWYPGTEKSTPPQPKDTAVTANDMTARQGDAIRMVVNLMRNDKATISKVLAGMTAQGFTAEETQEAVNEVAFFIGVHVPTDEQGGGDDHHEECPRAVTGPVAASDRPSIEE